MCKLARVLFATVVLLARAASAASAAADPEWPWRYLGSDVYRLSASARTAGWSVWLPNELATARAGRTVAAVVYAKRESGQRLGQIRLTATSESDATKSDTGSCIALAR